MSQSAAYICEKIFYICKKFFLYLWENFSYICKKTFFYIREKNIFYKRVSQRAAYIYENFFYKECPKEQEVNNFFDKRVYQRAASE